MLMYYLFKAFTYLTLFFLLSSCQITTQVSGCQNSVALGYGIFKVGDLKCTYKSDFQVGTSNAESRARNDDYNSFNRVQQIVHPNMFWNTKAIKNWDFKSGWYFVKLKNNCFTARVSNEQTFTFYSVCKNNFQSFNEDEAKRLLKDRFTFATFNSSSKTSNKNSSSSNRNNCKNLGFKKGSTEFKICLSNLAK